MIHNKFQSVVLETLILFYRNQEKSTFFLLWFGKKNYPISFLYYAITWSITILKNSVQNKNSNAQPMQNGQLKAGYNLQASTNNQFVVNYTLAQTTADTTTLIDHVDGFIESFDQAPEQLTADAGYGSEENYADLESKDIEAFVKYSYFHKEQLDEKGGTCKRPFAADKLYYNSEQDRCYCPMGQAMNHIGRYQRETKTGYIQTIDRYQARNCLGYPMCRACHKAKGNGTVERNHNLVRLKAKEKLLGPEGIAHRKQRCWDVEAVFGNIKQNMNFKHFMLRGIQKVETEIGLIAMAHNLKKVTLRA